MEPYFETEYVMITHNQNANVLLLFWLVQPSFCEYKKGLEMTINAFKHFKTGKIVVNAVNLAALSTYAREWTSSDWINRAKKAGYSHAAMVVTDEVSTIMSAVGTVNNGNGLVKAFFDNMTDAFEWIKRQV